MTRQQLQSKADTVKQKKTSTCLYAPLLEREKSTEARTVLCSAVPALRGTDTMSSSSKLTSSVPGHQRLDTMSMSAGCLKARKNAERRCVKSVTLCLSALQLMMEDVDVCRACNSLTYLRFSRCNCENCLLFGAPTEVQSATRRSCTIVPQVDVPPTQLQVA